MTAYQLLSVLTLLQLSTSSVHAQSGGGGNGGNGGGGGKVGSGFQSCTDQRSCLDISVAQVAAQCHDQPCEFQACITLDKTLSECQKSGAISHICGEEDGDIDDCEWNPLELGDMEDFTQCQVGAPGEMLTFVYKDGAGCSDALEEAELDPFATQIDTEAADTGPGGVSCRSRQENEVTCTGSGNEKKECIWTIALPQQCGGPTCPATGDVSVSFDLAAGSFCEQNSANSNFDVSFGGIPAGGTVSYSITDGQATYSGTWVDGDTLTLGLVPKNTYTVEVDISFASVNCDTITLSEDADCSCRQPDGSGDCPAGQICCREKDVCDEYNPNAGDADACGDPHMTGFLGQKFDFTGEDGEWYALIADENMNINMRVSCPVADLPEITYITGLSVLATDFDGLDHSIVIEVKDPHSLDSSCPADVSPCLADGSLRVLLDGEEALLAPGTVSLGDGVEVSAANLPGACRSFGFEKYWELKKLEYAAHARRLGESLTMAEWILGDPTATNMAECEEYMARAEAQDGGVFSHQSEHASFQIVTPKGTIRLSHGKLHQIAMRDPTDQYDLPDHLTWQMNMAVDHNEVSRDARGILGETFVPTRDTDGKPIMTGMEAIRGTQEDYRVEGAHGMEFAQGARTS